jgi:hypothetical protein
MGFKAAMIENGQAKWGVKKVIEIHFLDSGGFMKQLISMIFILLLSACGKESSIITPTSTQGKVLSGPYLGQALPGPDPVSFGNSLLRGGYHSSPTFLTDGSEIYWGGVYGSATIFSLKQEDGIWQDQKALVLPGDMSKIRDPFISPDGLKMYFLSPDPLPGSTEFGKENIWVTQRDASGWGKPEPLPEVINHRDLHWTISVAANGNLYFSSGSGGIGDIYLSEFENGTYSAVEKLPFPVNEEIQIETTPNIAPDESYILFSRMATTNDTPRLFISYATSTGWTEPVMVENIANCISPIVTPDRRFVFCTAGPSMLVWRDTSFIEELRP